MLLGILLALVLPDGDPATSPNPVFTQLTEQGIVLSNGQKVTLQPPVMPDGLDAVAQTAILEKLGGRKYSVADLTRPSIVAPHIFNLDQKPLDDIQATIRNADLYFVGRANLDSIAKKEFIDNMIDSGDKSGQSEPLSPEVLKKFNIEIDPRSEDRENYGLVRFTLFDKVKLQMTGHSYWNRTEDSITYAMIVDQAFDSDDKLAATWQLFRRKDNGELAPAESGKFSGAGLYLKITQLKKPEASVFVELHLVFIEPKAWFVGANLIGSKLPPIAQSQVRDIRRKAEKASAELKSKQ